MHDRVSRFDVGPQLVCLGLLAKSPDVSSSYEFYAGI